MLGINYLLDIVFYFYICYFFGFFFKVIEVESNIILMLQQRKMSRLVRNYGNIVSWEQSRDLSLVCLKVYVVVYFQIFLNFFIIVIFKSFGE